MSITSLNRRSALWGIVLLGAVPLAGCSGGSSGTAVTLSVVEFVGAGTDGVIYRNQPLVFLFNADLDPESVSLTGLQVRSNDQVFPGRIEVQGNRILWSPVVLPGDRNDYNPPNFPPANGLGFEGDARYTVLMLGGSPFSIHSKQGRPLAGSYQASFTTSSKFMPEETPVAPFVLTDRSPVFDPPPIVDGDPYSDDPADWPLVDPSSVTIRVDFSETMSPDPIDPLSSFTVTNVTDIPVDPPRGLGRPALVDVSLSREADSAFVTPLVTLGDWPDSPDPYLFEVRMTQALTDLGGNPLDEEVVFHFRTADSPGELNYSVITEDFTDIDFRDASHTNARWIGKGALEGKDVGRRITEFVPTPQSNFLLAHPLVEVGNRNTPNGCRFQMNFSKAQIGANDGDSIIAMSWAPRSNFVFFSSYRNAVIKLGHFPGSNGSLDFEFDKNYDKDLPNNPVTLFQGDYNLPASLNSSWYPWPEFSKDFEYDTSRDLVFEWDMPAGGTTFQIFRNMSTASTPRHRMFANGGSKRSSNGRENTLYNHRFELASKRSFGQSIGYGVDPLPGRPTYGAFLVVKDSSRAGTSIHVQWARATPGVPVTASGEWFDDIGQLDGSQGAAFRAELTANPFTGVVPRLFSISFAVADADEAGP